MRDLYEERSRKKKKLLYFYVSGNEQNGVLIFGAAFGPHLWLLERERRQELTRVDAPHENNELRVDSKCDAVDFKLLSAFVALL